MRPKEALAAYLSSPLVRHEPRTEKTIWERVRHWCRLMGDGPIDQNSLPIYRKRALDQEFAPATIEATVYQIRRLLAWHGEQLEVGRRVRQPRPSPDVPEPAHIGACYAAATVASWPTRYTSEQRAAWWRAWLVLGVWTAYRRSDLAGLIWRDVSGDVFTRSLFKVRRFGNQRPPIPITPLVGRHLESIRFTDHDHNATVFNCTTAWKQFRDSARKISDAAGVPYWTPKHLRQLGITLWTMANSEAGRIIHGCGLGVMGHYLDQRRLLERVADEVELPAEFYTPWERAARRREERQLLSRFKKAKSADRRLILDLSKRIG